MPKKTINATPETHGWFIEVKHKMETEEKRMLSANQVLNRLIVFYNTDGGRK